MKINKKLIFISLLLLLNSCAVRVSYDENKSILNKSEISESNKKNNDRDDFKSFANPINNNFKKFVLKRNPRLDEKIADDIIKYVLIYSDENKISPKLVLAVMAAESSFRADVVSSSGAIGLGQLLKSTAKDMGVENPFDIEGNVKATTKFLAKLLKSWDGNIDYSLASYKMGFTGAKKAINSWDGLPESTRKYISDIKKLHDSISDNE